MTEDYNRLPLIGDKAPAFQALTTNGTIHFPEDYEGKWVLFFSHPSGKKSNVFICISLFHLLI